MTKYSELTDEEKNNLEDIFKDDSSWNKWVTPEKKSEIIDNIKSDLFCTECWMIYYNCLCSHEN